MCGAKREKAAARTRSVRAAGGVVGNPPREGGATIYAAPIGRGEVLFSDSGIQTDDTVGPAVPVVDHAGLLGFLIDE